jgi:serine/threonine protein kinase
MELLEGHTLRAVLAERGRLTAPEAAMLGGQLLSALAAVHEHGVVHRDVKPSNLVVTRGRRGIHVKLVDFGAAKPTSENERAITKPSEVIGTPGYLSPEQLIAGAVVDARTDLFAAGVVMFEMLSGERPFGRRDVDLLRGTARGAPMEKLPEQLSRPFRELLSRLLAPSPDDRPASALDALAHLLGTPEGEESQRSPSTLPPPQDTVLLVSPSESRRELWARMAASTGAKVVPVATVDAAVLLAEAGDVPVTVVVDRTAPARPSHVDDELETMHALLALPRHRLRRLVQVLRSQRSGPGLRRTGRVVELVMPVTEPDLAEVLKPEGTAGP